MSFFIRIIKFNLKIDVEHIYTIYMYIVNNKNFHTLFYKEIYLLLNLILMKIYIYMYRERERENTMNYI